MGRRNQCHWCWEYGHNQRTCPDKKARLDQIKVDDPEAYERYQKRHTRRTVRCGYCRVEGHTIRKCEQFSSIVSTTIQKAIDQRSLVKRVLEQENFGPGSLVACPVDWSIQNRQFVTKEDGDLATDFLAVVLEIDYERIMFDDAVPDDYGYARSCPVKVQALADPTLRQWVNLPCNIFTSVQVACNGHMRKVVRLQSPSSSDIPADFMNLLPSVQKRAYTWAKKRYTNNK